jgi:iron-sulfur cluster insertion protein
LNQQQIDIIVTEAAVQKVHELIIEEDNLNLCLRVFVVGGGCSGFQYGFTFDEEKQDDDYVIVRESPIDGKGITVLVDHLSMQYLRGATVDYKEDLNGAQFIITNPNAKTTCGCGSSFATD